MKIIREIPIFKLIIIPFLLALIIAGCSSHKSKIVSTPRYDMCKIEIPQGPDWFFNNPNKNLSSENFSIGFSSRSYSPETMIDAAKQMAAVLKSRNTAAYSIRKFAKTETDNIYQNGSASFHLEVSACPATTQRIYENLTLVDSFFINDNFVGLFSETDDRNFNNEISLPPFPNWTTKPPIRVEENFVISMASTTSASLIPAYEAAIQAAREELLAYYITSVNSKIINKDYNTQTDVIVESAGKLVKIQINHCFLTTRFQDGLYSYEVTVELAMSHSKKSSTTDPHR